MIPQVYRAYDQQNAGQSDDMTAFHFVPESENIVTSVICVCPLGNTSSALPQWRYGVPWNDSPYLEIPYPDCQPRSRQFFIHHIES